MILLLSCRANEARWERIRDGWLVPCGIPFVIVVGDALLPRGSHAFDEASRVLTVGCEDSYDELSSKVTFAMRAIHARFRPAFLFKMDDDVLADPAVLKEHASIPAHIQYGGTVNNSHCVTAYGSDKFGRLNRALTRVDAVFCNGPMYFLRARAIDVLAARMDPAASKYEDVAVGMALGAHGIKPEALLLFTEDEREFNRGVCVAWHDASHASSQNRTPRQPATVTLRHPRASFPREYTVASAVATVIPARGRADVQTGLVLRSPPGARSEVRTLMSTARQGIDVCAFDTEGDGDGDGVVVMLHNHGDEPFAVPEGAPIARLVFTSDVEIVCMQKKERMS